MMLRALAETGVAPMSYTIEQFAAECRRILAADSGPAGREEVRALLGAVCSDEDFVATYLGDDVSERQILHEDPELGFCIVGHVEQPPRLSRPHDHGPTWAIYGQAAGETIMLEWEIVSPPPSADMPGKARRVRGYTMTPGSAHIFNEGEVHSPFRCGSTRLLRVEGSNLDHICSAHYEEV
jgi:predicted metal-dependent enzyme (double-stranded beta helix superfamily)